MGLSQSKYEVFISFRGRDVRDNFLSHLFSALERKKIKTFKDENIARGVVITPSILKIIEYSKISIVIFSQHFPDSPWCLDELQKITERREKKKQIVVPIFYRIDPSDVHNLRGTYGSAIRKYNQDPRFTDKVDHWKIALQNISNLSGFHSDNPLYWPESRLIEEVVKYISEDLSEEMKQFIVGRMVGAFTCFMLSSITGFKLSKVSRMLDAI